MHVPPDMTAETAFGGIMHEHTALPGKEYK